MSPPNGAQKKGATLKTQRLTTILAAAFVLSSVVTSSDAEARDRVDRRQTRQNARVYDGKQSGEITDQEAARLRHSKRIVRRAENRAESDGVVTDAEKVALEKMQDARSKQIHRIKSNDKKEDLQ